MSTIRLLVALLVLALSSAGCGTVARAGDDATPGGAGQRAGGGQLSIVATTGVLADVTSSVAGDDAQVTALMPAGADPHTFEASPGNSRSCKRPI